MSSIASRKSVSLGGLEKPAVVARIDDAYHSGIVAFVSKSAPPTRCAYNCGLSRPRRAAVPPMCRIHAAYPAETGLKLDIIKPEEKRACGNFLRAW